jgi:hypothetical protein
MTAEGKSPLVGDPFWKSFPQKTVGDLRRTVADLRIVPKDGGTELQANALARVVGCLARSGSD